MCNQNENSEKNEGLFKRLNIKSVIAIPYKPGVVTRYFNRLNSKNESQRSEKDIPSD